MGIETPRAKRIIEPGQFEAWLVATDRPNQGTQLGSSGPSGHGWEIHRAGTTNVEDRSAVASGPASEESNGYVTGVYRIVEALPESSVALIWTCGNNVIQALKDGIDALRERDFKGANGKPLKLEAYWRKISDLCAEKRLSVRSELLVKTFPHDVIYKTLRRDVRAECAKLCPSRPGR